MSRDRWPVQVLDVAQEDAEGRRGVVWLAQEEMLGERVGGAFNGYWEADLGGPVLEEVEVIATVELAIVWGRARARHVLVRLARGGYFSAGVVPPNWGLEAPNWPD